MMTPSSGSVRVHGWCGCTSGRKLQRV